MLSRPRALVLLEALVELKNPMALSGIEPDPLGLLHSASANYFTVRSVCFMRSGHLRMRHPEMPHKFRLEL